MGGMTIILAGVVTILPKNGMSLVLFSFWWKRMKKDAPLFVLRYFDLSISESRTPKNSRFTTTIWVIVDRLTKSAHFLPIHLSNSVEDLSVIYVHKIVRLHEVLVSIISDRNPYFTSLFWKEMQSVIGSDLRLNTTFHPQTNGQFERTIQVLDDMLWACIPDFGGSSKFSGVRI